MNKKRNDSRDLRRRFPLWSPEARDRRAHAIDHLSSGKVVIGIRTLSERYSNRWSETTSPGPLLISEGIGQLIK